MSKSNSIAYSFFKPWVIVGAQFYYKKIQLVNRNNIPKNVPVILVANHQNALMDVLSLCIKLPKQLHWLTRADIFKKPSVNKFLRSINMLPVYRERDNVEDLSGTNNKTFIECNEKLENDFLLCMFPEGAHRGKKQLMPLKKGVARIALNAVSNGLEELCIVPVGIHHSNYYNYRSTIFLNVGKPIHVKPFITEPANIPRTQNTLLSSISTSLKEVMIDIENESIYEQIVALEPLCNKLSKSDTLPEQFSYFQKTIQAIEMNEDTHQQLIALVNPYTELQKELRIKEKLFSDERFSFLKIIALVFGALPAIIAFIFFYPMYFFAAYIVKKIVKDPIFVNTIRFGVWTFLTPFYLLIMASILSLIMGLKLTLICLIVFAICGIISLNWRPLYKQYLQQRRCNQYASEQNSKYIKWLKIRQELKQFINQLNNN